MCIRDSVNNSYKMDDNSKAFIDDMREKYKYVISTQLVTQTDFTELGQAKIQMKKSWSKYNIQKFFDICAENNIGVLNLSSISNTNFKNVIDLSNVDVCSLINVIRQMDMHVGIDSVFGHIAGVFYVPNLILFGRNTAHWTISPDEKIKMHVSYVPFTRNLSLSNEKGDINAITPEIVWNKMMNLIANPGKLSEKLVTYDSINCEYV